MLVDKKVVSHPQPPGTPVPRTIAGRLDLFIDTMEMEENFGSSQAAADALGLLPQNLSKYKLPKDPTKPSNRNRSLPSAEKLAMFASVGLSMEWLFRGGDISQMIYTGPPVAAPSPAVLSELTRAQAYAEATLESIRKVMDQANPGTHSNNINSSEHGDRS